MPGILSKKEIIQQLFEVSNEFVEFNADINSKDFFYQPADKWSVVQNITHLTTASKSTLLAFMLPKFIIRLYTGKPNRPSRTYDELVTKYKLKLEQGGRASGRFIPKPVTIEKGKEKILTDFSKAMTRLSATIDRKWNDEELDQYIAPHPLLGKITLRELCYFTIYHTRHHLANIKERLKEKI
jgi:hypothetical protein